MADETPKVQNKGLLLVALALGVIVVVIYNVHINAVRNEGKGQVVRLLQLTTAKNAGEVLEEKDLTSVPIEKSNADKLGNVVPESEKRFAVGRTMNEQVQQGQYLLWGHIESSTRSEIFKSVTPGNIIQVFEINPKSSPGPLLQPGGYVNILGKLSLGGKAPRYYRIMQGVRVLATGANLPAMETDNPNERARNISRSYRTIAIEIDPKVGLQLKNIQSRLPENDIEVLPKPPTEKGYSPKINPQEPELLKLAESAVAGTAHGSGPESGTP